MLESANSQEAVCSSYSYSSKAKAVYTLPGFVFIFFLTASCILHFSALIMLIFSQTEMPAYLGPTWELSLTSH